jgi:decaprenyl-phosphate phosphoribosyltransferase
MASSPLALLRAVRPKQWLKNSLVFAAPLAAGALLEPHIWPLVVIAFVAFCAAASGIYLLNDLLDVNEDRAHPKKRFRPIASGSLGVPSAIVACVLALLIALGLPLLVGLWNLTIVLAIYLVIQVAYCFWLKHLVVIDLVVVSSGFLIRAVAGAVTVGVPPSQWFLLVMSFGSLFMVAGKRFSEKLEVDQEGGATRRSLEGYSLGYLRFAWSLAATIALIAYALWAFELGAQSDFPWAAISIVPFGTALLRYAYSIESGRAGAPEDTVLGDRQLAILGIVWLATFALVVAFR